MRETNKDKLGPHEEYKGGGERHRLLQRGENRDEVIRIIPDAIIMKHTGDRVTSISGNFKTPERKQSRVRALLDELAAYGIHAPTRIEKEIENGNEMILGTTENIREATLASENERREYLSDLRALMGNLIRYYEHKKDALGYFLSDITRRDQYAFGKKKGDVANHLYLIDPDAHHSDDPRVYRAVVGDLLKWIEHIESSFSSYGIRMGDEKDRCKKLLE